jgi:hypothetical protein
MTDPPTTKGIYRANRPLCSACGKPIEDSEDRDQRAGKVYHSGRSPCREAYLKTGKGRV